MIKAIKALPLAAVLFTGCHKDSAPVPTPSKAPVRAGSAASKTGPTPQELTAGMVEAATIGKSTMPVDLKFDLTSRPEIGQSLEVQIAVMPQVAGGPVKLVATGTAGLQVEADSAPLEVETVEPAHVYRFSLSATPRAEGVLLIALNVSMTHDEFIDTRAFSIPIIVSARTASTEIKKPL